MMTLFDEGTVAAAVAAEASSGVPWVLVLYGASCLVSVATLVFVILIFVKVSRKPAAPVGYQPAPQPVQYQQPAAAQPTPQQQPPAGQPAPPHQPPAAPPQPQQPPAGQQPPAEPPGA